MLTVQYPETQVKSLTDFKRIPLRSAVAECQRGSTCISRCQRIQSPTEVDHYQLRRAIDIYVRPLGEDLGRYRQRASIAIIAQTKVPEGLSVTLRGMVQGMRHSFHSFSFGLILAVVLLYLILVAQFQLFVDPLLFCWPSRPD